LRYIVLILIALLDMNIIHNCSNINEQLPQFRELRRGPFNSRPTAVVGSRYPCTPGSWVFPSGIPQNQPGWKPPQVGSLGGTSARRTSGALLRVGEFDPISSGVLRGIRSDEWHIEVMCSHFGRIAHLMIWTCIEHPRLFYRQIHSRGDMARHIRASEECRR